MIAPNLLEELREGIPALKETVFFNSAGIGPIPSVVVISHQSRVLSRPSAHLNLFNSVLQRSAQPAVIERFYRAARYLGGRRSTAAM